jgi:hypothetical protein
MNDDEDLLPRSGPPEAHQDIDNSTQYAWVECKMDGWQTLIKATDAYGLVPEPPSCVLLSQKKSQQKAGGNLTTIPDSSETFPSPRMVNRPLSPRNGQGGPLPEKNFVLANIRNTSPPKRHTRTALLDQAVIQLRESEIVSASLAKRLNIIQTRLSK